MEAGRQPPRRRSIAVSRLLDHCETLNRMTAAESGTARSRLEDELGAELAHRLVAALGRTPRGRPAPLC